MNCPNCGARTRAERRDYEYVESGLRNVLLQNITVHKCPNCGEELPEICNVEQIHKWISEYLIRKSTALTGEEVRFLRKQMGKSAKDFAPFLGVSPVTISRWENNKERIGPQSDRLIRMLFAAGTAVASASLDHARIAAIVRELPCIYLRLREIHGRPKREKIIVPRLPEREGQAAR